MRFVSSTHAALATRVLTLPLMGLSPIEHICLFWTYTEVPSLHRSYPASQVLRTSPPPHTTRSISHELRVDPDSDHRGGFPCCVWSLLPACHRHYPGRSNGACSLVRLHRLRPSLCNSQVGSCNYCFGACSAFTHVMACTLAESLNDPLHRKLRQLRCLRRRFDCYRVERTSSRAGVAPAEVQRLSRRTVSPIEAVCHEVFRQSCSQARESPQPLELMRNPQKYRR